MSIDFAWRRLGDAWHPPPALNARPEDPQLSGLTFTKTGSSMRQIDVVTLAVAETNTAWALGGPDLHLDSLAHADLQYRIETQELTDAIDVPSLLAERRPRLLVVDAGLCERRSAAGLRALRRVSPATDWIVGWPVPRRRHAQAIINSQARGCIEWSAPVAQLAHAFDAILGGQLWFPRIVSHWLYLALLERRATDASAPVAEQPQPAGAKLTSREAEVMALMSEGLTNKEIGQRLAISLNTVKKHLARAFEKRGMHSRRQTYGQQR